MCFVTIKQDERSIGKSCIYQSLIVHVVVIDVLFRRDENRSSTNRRKAWSTETVYRTYLIKGAFRVSPARMLERSTARIAAVQLAPQCCNPI